VPKIFYGILTDTFPLCGSTKKSWLRVLGTIFCISATLSGFYDGDSPWPLVLNVALSMVCSAIMDVVVDGLMVTQSRLDPESGSEDLQSYQWACAAISGIVGYYIGGVMTQNGYSSETFFISAALGLIINISACFLDSSLEDLRKEIDRMNCCRRTKHNFSMIKQGFATKALSRSFIFFLL
jgi:MFS family permease